MFILEVLRPGQEPQLKDYYRASECTDAILRIDQKFVEQSWTGTAEMRTESGVIIAKVELNDHNRIT